MPAIFDVNTVFFTVLAYPMSYIEFFGTLLNLASVYLVARKNMWTWPIGLVAVVVFAALFYQVRLYADFLEQIYYFGSLIYGWVAWSRGKHAGEALALDWSSRRTASIWLAVTALGSVALGALVERLHLIWPTTFPEAATYPYIDAATTAGSFVAMILMAQRRVEAWVYWIVIDVVSVWLYAVKGLSFVSVLYGIYLALAFYGLARWRRA